MNSLTSSEKTLLTKMLTSHAYREKLAAERFTQALDFAPSPEDRNYIKHIIEEEQYHYQGCLSVAKKLDIDLATQVDIRMEQDPPGIPPFQDWLDAILAHAFNDRAGYHVLAGLMDSKISEYAKLATVIVSEEKEHGEQGATFLADYYPHSQDLDKQKRLLYHLDAAIRCLGKPGSANEVEALKLKLKTKAAHQMITEFCQEVDPILVKIGCANLVPLANRYLQ